mgnify:CR=1 FL=1
MNRAAGSNARMSALALLAAVLDDGQNLSDASPGGAGLDPRDRAFARHLAYGVLRWRSALEWLASGLLNKPLKRRDRDIQRLILLGLYQLWQDETSPHAAINETTECARLAGKTWAVGLVNGVLRRFQRERDARIAALEKTEHALAHPAWLLQALRQDWPENWKRIAQANNLPAPLWLRLNARHDEAATLGRLQQDGLAITRHPLVETAVRIEPARNVDQLPGFSEGLISVQDPAAQLAVELLAPGPGQRVLDACSAPGGKTGHLLEAQADIQLTSLDRSAARLQRVRENLQRLRLADPAADGGAVRLLAEDAAETSAWWDGKPCQRILLDAPCTATGVIRRHPEIKWLRSTEQVGEAVRLQRTLLDRLWPLLETGGMLLYATCSILQEENNLQIKAFLDRTADAEEVALQADWGRAMSPGRQILPGEYEMDGFFYALLRKTC